MRRARGGAPLSDAASHPAAPARAVGTRSGDTSPDPQGGPPRLILASQSPSRAGLLRAGGCEPEQIPAGVDEAAVRAGLADEEPAAVVAALAAAKARAVAERVGPGCIVIGCDSMLLLDGVLQGKPHTAARVVERWRAQAGRSAELLTGHCVLGPHGGEVTETVRTRVHFAAARDDEIAAYAATGQPLECAGAFTLEALGGWFIDAIEGDPSSVIGLSLPLVRRALNHFGWPVHAFWR